MACFGVSCGHVYVKLKFRYDRHVVSTVLLVYSNVKALHNMIFCKVIQSKPLFFKGYKVYCYWLVCFNFPVFVAFATNCIF